MTTVASIVIAYNEKEFLEFTLPPIKAVSDQVIVVDMGSTDGSADLYGKILNSRDMVIPYERANLVNFGFSHPRNYGAKFACTDWIFAIDCDEYLEVEPTRSELLNLNQATSDCFNITRRNYVRSEQNHINDIRKLVSECIFSEEPHRRLYRNIPRARFEGVIHEELWIGETNAYHSSTHLPIVLHHLNQFKPDGNEHAKFGLYSYLTLRAILYPGMRYGTNNWWFSEFPKLHFSAMVEASNEFCKKNDLAELNSNDIREQLQKENIIINN